MTTIALVASVNFDAGVVALYDVVIIVVVVAATDAVTTDAGVIDL